MRTLGTESRALRGAPVLVWALPEHTLFQSPGPREAGLTVTPFYRWGRWGLELSVYTPRAWSWQPRAATWRGSEALPWSPVPTWPRTDTFLPRFPNFHQHLTTTTARDKPRRLMCTAGEAKSLILPSCAEGLAGDLAWATRGAMIQRAGCTRESGPPAAGQAVTESSPRLRSVLAGRLAQRCPDVPGHCCLDHILASCIKPLASSTGPFCPLRALSWVFSPRPLWTV